jgi:hypothetical protein
MIGYNFNGFTDEELSINNYNQKGVYLKLKAKFNQKNLINLLKVFSW